MKKIKLMMMTLMMCLVGMSYGQEVEFNKNYLGRDFDLYKGVYLKVDTNANMPYGKWSDSTSANRYNITIDSLKNKIFFVNDVLKFKRLLVIKDTNTSEIYYFNYDVTYERNFPFLTSKIPFDACSKIEREVDEFTNEVQLYSPYSTTLSINKYIKGGKSYYYLSLYAKGSTVNVNIKGVTILFEDGSKMLKPNEKIDVDVSGGFRYSAFIPLTQLDLQKLGTTKITKFRLYIYDKDIPSIEGEKFTQYVNCIKDKK